MVRTLDKMNIERKDRLLLKAEAFLETLTPSSSSS
jgi:hypothetical protein